MYSIFVSFIKISFLKSYDLERNQNAQFLPQSLGRYTINFNDLLI